jgi:hypothetical protein
MEMILLDWTRMGTYYCLAGAVAEGGSWRMVRPLLAKFKNGPVRNLGWSAYLMDGRCRWEVFQLVGVQPAAPQPPHTEDIWVAEMRSLKRLASPAQRRTVLEAGLRPAGTPLFGVRLSSTRAAAYLLPDTGTSSLATVLVRRGDVTFTAAVREGATEPDCRVLLNLPGLQERTLAVKDHFLLRRAEAAGNDPNQRVRALTLAVSQMGETVAVRLGLTRAFSPAEGQAGQPGRCWMMADGFFSYDDPQP